VIWIALLACVAVILTAGSRLTRYGDVIAEKTGLGRAWVGLVLLASVTSLPELVTGVSSVAFFNAPNIALGDIVGSCMFNLLIIALLDALERQQPISTRVHEGQALSASFGVFMLGIAAIGLLGGKNIPVVGHHRLISPQQRRLLPRGLKHQTYLHQSHTRRFFRLSFC
jgi:cation:H+ antiporter